MHSVVNKSYVVVVVLLLWDRKIPHLYHRYELLLFEMFHRQTADWRRIITSELESWARQQCTNPSWQTVWLYELIISHFVRLFPTNIRILWRRKKSQTKTKHKNHRCPQNKIDVKQWDIVELAFFQKWNLEKTVIHRTVECVFFVYAAYEWGSRLCELTRC